MRPPTLPRGRRQKTLQKPRERRQRLQKRAAHARCRSLSPTCREYPHTLSIPQRLCCHLATHCTAMVLTICRTRIQAQAPCLPSCSLIIIHKHRCLRPTTTAEHRAPFLVRSSFREWAGDFARSSLLILMHMMAIWRGAVIRASPPSVCEQDDARYCSRTCKLGVGL